MYENEFRANCDNLIIATDDGSKGIKGLVTDALEEGLENGKYDCVMAVGPLPMMKAVCALTKRYEVKTVVSMNLLWWTVPECAAAAVLRWADRRSTRAWTDPNSTDTKWTGTALFCASERIKNRKKHIIAV